MQTFFTEKLVRVPFGERSSPKGTHSPSVPRATLLVHVRATPLVVHVRATVPRRGRTYVHDRFVTPSTFGVALTFGATCTVPRRDARTRNTEGERNRVTKIIFANAYVRNICVRRMARMYCTRNARLILLFSETRTVRIVHTVQPGTGPDKLLYKLTTL